MRWCFCLDVRDLAELISMSCGITHWDAFRMGQLGIMVCLFCVLVRGGSRLSGKRCHADVFPLFGWRKSRVRCILVDGEGRVGYGDLL